MALERVGLGAVVTADTRPMVKAMATGRDEMGRFVAGANKVPPSLGRIGMAATRLATKIRVMATRFKSGAAMMGAGMMKLGMGLLPMGLALGGAIKKAADFEKQMSAVSAITQATAEDQAALAKKAKQTGIVSAFSATQAAEGMEFMGRAGANTAEILSGLDGVTNLAAADSIDLAASADIVSRVVRGMGLEFSDAAHIADVLALASAKSNTNVQALGQSFIYGASTARQAGISLEETVSIFGKMADAGLKGSLAGTGLTNMLGKLTKPTSKAASMMKKWKISLDKADGSLRPVADIVEDFSKKIEALPKKSQRLAAAQEIFGKRGARAYGALAAAGSEATKTLEELLLAASEGEGAAARMAAKRLDNLIGKFTLLKSSLEGLAISVFGPLLEIWSKGIGGITDSLNTVLFAVMDIEEATVDGVIDVDKAAKAYTKYGGTAYYVAIGIKDATKAIGDAFTWLQDKIKEAAKSLSETLGEDGIRKLTKIVIIIGTIAGALAPMLLAGMMLKWVFGGLIGVLAGLAKMVFAAFWPMVIIAGIALIAWHALKNENESFMDTAYRTWSNIKAWAIDVYDNALRPMWEGIRQEFIPALGELESTWQDTSTNIKMVFQDLFDFMSSELDIATLDWETYGKLVGHAAATTLQMWSTVIKYAVLVVASIVKAIHKIFSFVYKVIKFFITEIIDNVNQIILALKGISGQDILGGFKRLGVTILDSVLKPLQLLMKVVVLLAKALGKKLPEKLKTFAESGLSGVIYGGRGGEKGGARRKGVAPIAPPTAPRHVFAALSATDEGRKATAKLAKIDWAAWEKSTKGMTKEEIRIKYGEGYTPGSAAEKATGLKAAAKAAGLKQPKIDVGVNLEDKRQLDIKNEMCIDGEGVTIASARHKQELQERAGFKATPWQRRAMLEHGAAPVKQAS